MKRWGLFTLVCLIVVLGVSGTALAKSDNGYDQWGYNYQAHMFNGYFGNYTRPDVPVTSGAKLIMKWNEAWLSRDRIRHDGYPTYVDSGAWLTNHYWDEDGSYFCKIIAVNTGDVLVSESYTDVYGNVWTDGVWYTAEGQLIGPSIWGSFALIQENLSGSTPNFKGYRPGFGNLN